MCSSNYVKSFFSLAELLSVVLREKTRDLDRLRAILNYHRFKKLHANSRMTPITSKSVLSKSFISDCSYGFAEVELRGEIVNIESMRLNGKSEFPLVLAKIKVSKDSVMHPADPHAFSRAFDSPLFLCFAEGTHAQFAEKNFSKGSIIHARASLFGKNLAQLKCLNHECPLEMYGVVSKCFGGIQQG